MDPASCHRPPIRDPEVLERMRMTFELYQAAEDLMRQNLRRRNPSASAERIEQGIREWLAGRPGVAEDDDVWSSRRG